MNFSQFYEQFMALGPSNVSESNAFNPKNVKDYPTFWAEFSRAGCPNYCFRSRNVNSTDFQTFYAEFTYSGYLGCTHWIGNYEKFKKNKELVKRLSGDLYR